ncbi:M14 family zinc carboxypeptidase [Streptomyces sp. NPDC054784]
MPAADPKPSTPAAADGTQPGAPDVAGRRWVEHVATVPPADAYPGVDELLAAFRALAARHPERVTERRIGTSGLGEPLLCFSVRADATATPRTIDSPQSPDPDDTAPHYVVVGGVHPNEPVGAVTALHLATALCEDPSLRGHFGGEWHVVPCVDPDGARLNEGWFRSPADKWLYGRHFYRPAGDKQVEWTFPFAYRDAYFDRVLPETFALMRLIDATRPRFLTTLHNCEAGGVYYYLSSPAPDLYPVLEAIPAAAGIPLATGEPEAAHTPRHAPAVYGCIDMRDAYDHLDGLGADAAAEIAGSSSAAYAARYGTFYFVTEVPHWSHPEADDGTPLPRRHADVIRERAASLRATGLLLGGLLDRALPHLTLRTPFLAAVRAFVPSLVTAADLETNRAAELPDRPATVADRYACLHSAHSCRIRFGGMLLRALAAEITAGTAGPVVRACHAELLAVYEGWEAEADPVTGEPIPVATLAGVQYAALLAAADHARAAGAAQGDRT